MAIYEAQPSSKLSCLFELEENETVALRTLLDSSLADPEEPRFQADEIILKPLDPIS